VRHSMAKREKEMEIKRGGGEAVRRIIVVGFH
jgi:hypothetical protein